MDTKILIALITAGTTILASGTTLIITSIKDYKQKKNDNILKLIEKKEIEEVKELEAAVLSFISSVERFIRIKLYIKSNGEKNEDKPTFTYYSELMNEVESHFSKLMLIIDNENKQLLGKLIETKNVVINEDVIVDLRERLDSICGMTKEIKKQKLKAYYNLIKTS